MPIWLRKFHIQKINEHNKKQREELEKAQQKGNTPKKPMGPGINPSSVYNFKK